MPARKKTSELKAAPDRSANQGIFDSGFIDPWENSFLRDYFSEVRKRFGAVRVLNVGAYQDESDYHINDIFVRPALSKEYVSLGAAERGDESELGSDLLDIVENQRHLVVLGDPGSGKSTLISWLAWSLANPEKIRPANRVLGPLVPMPIILREAAVPDLLKDEERPDFERLLDVFLGQSFAGGLDTDQGRKLLRELYASDQIFLMFDGLDELSAAKKHWFQKLWFGQCRIERNRTSRVLITSRVVGYEGSGIDHIKVAPPKIKKSARESNSKKIDELAQKDIFDLRVDLASLYYAAPFGKSRIEDFSRKWYRLRVKPQSSADARAARFIADVAQHPALSELRHSPLLLTFMAIVHNAKERLPDGRVSLYRAIVEAYIEGLRSKDSKAYRTEDVHDALAAVAWEAQKLRDESQASDNDDADEGLMLPESRVKSIMTATLAAKLGAEPGEDYVAEFLRHCKERTGLLYPRGERKPVDGGEKEEHYTFAHLSFQEYFACKAIYRGLARSWVIRSEEARGEFSRAKLHNLTGRAVWAETFQLLFESLSDPDSPLDPADFAGYIFDPRSAKKNGMFQVSWSTKPQQAEVVISDSSTVADYLRTRLLLNCLTDSRITLGDTLRIHLLRSLIISAGPDEFHSPTLIDIFSRNQLRPIATPFLAEIARVNKWTRLRLDSEMLESEAFSNLSSFDALTSLGLVGPTSDNLADLPVLPRVTAVTVSSCDLIHFRWLDHFPKIENITIGYCENFLLSSLADLKSLRHLSVHDSDVSYENDILFAGLDTLDLWINGSFSCKVLSAFPAISQLTLFADEIIDATELKGMNGLRELTLWNCSNIDGFDFEKFDSLEVLRLFGDSGQSFARKFHQSRPDVEIMTYSRDKGWQPFFPKQSREKKLK